MGLNIINSSTQSSEPLLPVSQGIQPNLPLPITTIPDSQFYVLASIAEVDRHTPETESTTTIPSQFTEDYNTVELDLISGHTDRITFDTTQPGSTFLCTNDHDVSNLVDFS